MNNAKIVMTVEVDAQGNGKPGEALDAFAELMRKAVGDHLRQHLEPGAVKPDWIFQLFQITEVRVSVR